MAPKEKTARLPAHIVPERYRIMIHPDLEAFTFRGEETVFLDVRKPTKKIILHAVELKIKKAVLRYGGEIFSPKIVMKPDHEHVVFAFPKTIPKGKAELSIWFQGILNDRMHGFYRSKYIHKGEERHLAVTQFEATDARRAFPCIDEPAAKAIFDVTLIIPKHHTAISNTIETEVREHSAGFKAVTFAPTPRMSTYLLAMIAGEFEYIEGKTKRGIVVRVFVTPGKKHQAKFALDVAARTLQFYEEYFAIPYPLPVLDLIAIPDFAHGAMENWGAITYRETTLLVDEEHSSVHNRQWVALVIAHEIAHQWFGNLVTMEWWTHLWLNEGFASWIEYLAIDHLFPKWDIWTQFVVQDLRRALELDALKNTHPIEVHVHHPNEIREIFDAVSYSKGASLIRMLENYLGREVFRDGLRHYLTRHQFANASTADLWLALEEISGKPVRRIMSAWTEQAGYPAVKISTTGSTLTFRQTRFFSGSVSSRASDKTLWPIPLTIGTDGGARKNVFIEKRLAQIRLSKKPQWLKANLGETAFCRVNYSRGLWEHLKRGIREKRIPPADRIGVLDDAFALSRAGKMPLTEVLSVAEAYRGEDSYSVWVILLHNLRALDHLFADEPFLNDFRTFARGLLSGIVSKVGYVSRRDEPHTTSLLRGIVLRSAALYSDQNVIRWATGEFKKLERSGVLPHADLRAAVYGTVAQEGGRKEYGKFLRHYHTAHLHEEKIRLAVALGTFRDKKLLKKTLDFSISLAMRSQDTVSVISAVALNNHGRDLAWEFLKKRWEIFEKRYAHSGMMTKLISGVADHFTTDEKAREVREFFKKHPVPAAARTIEQAIEKIQSNTAWLKRTRREIRDWLKENANR